MSDTAPAHEQPKYIDGPKLRKRWGTGVSTFYDRLNRNVIPKPVYPFGPHKPYWDIATIEEHERAAEAAKEAA